MRILHITDPHLLADPCARLHGWPVADCFERVLCHALAHTAGIDALVLGGDLVDDESAAGYTWLDRRLAGIDLPVLAVAGNHDDPDRMQQCLSQAHVHRSLQVDGGYLYGLNSHRTGHADGRIGADALASLDASLARVRRPSLICVHHPPVALNSAWIDSIGLADGAELLTLLARHPHVRGVLSGHAHQASTSRWGPLTIWTTPSTMRQFLPGAAAFAEDRDRPPGYRVIDLPMHGAPVSRVVRVSAADVGCG
ncbi:metallophosphoesterase [Salinisphaera sp. T31B1]|uniref:metallophosphoesterase n=1 Tax=Salinisphaera sp. T31B1 TaxID=727963 RepID=UPI00334106E4